MPTSRPTLSFFTAALLSVALSACFFGSDGDKASASRKALQKNNLQREKWQKKGLPYYQYTLAYREDLLSPGYSGTCRVAVDTSFCDLVRRDDEYEIIGRISYPPAIEGFFSRIDSMIGMSPPPSLFAPDPVSDSLRITRDTLLYWVVIPDSTQEPPRLWPSGVVVVYDPVLGFPHTLIRAPLGPSFEITNLEEISATAE